MTEPVAPPFLPLGKAQRLLNLTSRSQMQNLLPCLPHLYVPARQSRLFPAAYIRGLAGYLEGRKATARLVRAYNGTEDARRLYRETRECLDTGINSRAEHTPMQVAEILGISRATIGGWTKSGALPAEARAPKEGQPLPEDPKLRRLFISRATLHGFFEWVSPF